VNGNRMSPMLLQTVIMNLLPVMTIAHLSGYIIGSIKSSNICMQGEHKTVLVGAHHMTRCDGKTSCTTAFDMKSLHELILACYGQASHLLGTPENSDVEDEVADADVLLPDYLTAKRQRMITNLLALCKTSSNPFDLLEEVLTFASYPEVNRWYFGGGDKFHKQKHVMYRAIIQTLTRAIKIEKANDSKNKDYKIIELIASYYSVLDRRDEYDDDEEVEDDYVY